MYVFKVYKALIIIYHQWTCVLVYLSCCDKSSLNSVVYKQYTHLLITVLEAAKSTTIASADMTSDEICFLIND